jgi:hypothetical protein
MSDTTMHAFLFSIEELTHGEHPYNRPPQRAVIEALREHAPGVSSLLASGDLILEQMSRKLTSVSSEGKHAMLAGRHGTVASYSLDRDVHMTLVWDLCDATATQVHDLDLERFAHVLMRHDGFVITVTGFASEAVLAASQDLRETRGYVGCLAVDYGNPVQHDVFSVPRFGYLLDGALVFDPWDTDRPEDPYPLDAHPDPWWESLRLRSVRYLTAEEPSENHPLPEWPAPDLSERGAQTAALLAGLTAPGHLDRLARGLTRRRSAAGPWAFSVDTASMPAASDAIVDPAKLAGYALNGEHPDGKHKARLFRDLLDISAEDAEFLAAQLKHGLANAESLASIRSDEWGVKYHVVTEVTGRNGRVLPVRAAWEVRDGGPPRLVTVYIAEIGTVGEPLEDTIAVNPRLSGDQRWAALWSAAHAAGERAAARCVPTPVSIEGSWMPDGLEGGAQVTIRDKRAGFARWLRLEGHARQGPAGTTVVVYGYDRGAAYAKAFADVLELNGVQAEIDTFLT